MLPRSRAKSGALVVLLLIVAVVGAVSYLAWRQSVHAPAVTLAAPRFLGRSTSFTVTVKARRGNLAHAEVRAIQAGATTTLAKVDRPRTARVDVPVRIEPAELGLHEGPATLEVWGRDDFWRPLRLRDRALASAPVTIDLTPPKLDIIASTRYVSPGGAALVAFRVVDFATIDVRVGGRVFPSFAMGAVERGTRVALVALPYDFRAGTPMTITAQDEAGNAVTRGIPGELKPRRFPHDTIRVNDELLRLKVPELLPQFAPSKPLIEGFLVINRDQRREAEQEKLKVGAKTADHPLWGGPFVQPRNTKVFSNFAETRTYIYDGKPIDTQVHYGYDLASTKHSPVPAANAGTVVYTGPLTIYGNAVILDHGLGLQTLYAHLSSIGVNAGDTVTKGQELGRTGSTGLAIGDHLHFEVLVSGVSVTPLEWWDAKWIRDRINGPLREAGLPEIGSVDKSASAPRRADTPRGLARPTAR